MPRYVRSDDNKWEISVFPSPVLCPCIHTHFITLVFVCRGRSIPVLPPSLSQSIPQLWCHQPSESLIYCLRLRFIKCGVKVGALQSFCACVCVCEGASVFVCCRSRSHLPYLWGFDSSLNRSRAKRCVFGLWETPAKSHLHAPQLEDARVWEGVRHVCLPLCESSNLFSCHTERGCSSLWFIQKVSSPGGI